MFARAEPNGDPIATPSVFTPFGGYVKQIMKNILRDLRGILIMLIQTINTDINGFVQWNVKIIY